MLIRSPGTWYRQVWEQALDSSRSETAPGPCRSETAPGPSRSETALASCRSETAPAASRSETATAASRSETATGSCRSETAPACVAGRRRRRARAGRRRRRARAGRRRRRARAGRRRRRARAGRRRRRADGAAGRGDRVIVEGHGPVTGQRPADDRVAGLHRDRRQGQDGALEGGTRIEGRGAAYLPEDVAGLGTVGEEDRGARIGAEGGARAWKMKTASGSP